MFQNYERDLQNLVQITASGIQIASFTQIRSALIQRYKTLYGSDIDLNTGSADGIFINDLALIINNMLQSMQFMYANLDVQTAQGIYLDALCKLSNVTRQGASASTTSLQVTNTSAVMSEEYTDLTFVDKSGTEWYCPGKTQFAGNEVKSLTVFCKELGSIKAPIGWIDRTLEVTYLTVIQANAAIEGNTEESDSHLRSRRAQSSGASGLTVLESLIGALLNIAGIEDVKIYNNNSTSSILTADGSTVDAHSVYVVIRKQTNVEIADEVIGTIIHEKMTPGIHSCISSGIDGAIKSYVYVSEVFGVTISESQQSIYWKQATPIHPTITITLTAMEKFSDSYFERIAPAIMKYMNSLPLGEIATSMDLMMETVSADPQFKGRPTYIVNSATVSDSQSDTFYNYTTYSFTHVDAVWTLTIN